MSKTTLSGGETRPWSTIRRRVAWSRVVVAIALVLSSGCDLPQTRPPQTSARTNGAGTVKPDAEAVAPPHDGRVTLPQALAYAREHAPDAVVAASEVGLGDAEVVASEQAQPFNPTISIGLGQRRQAGGTGLDAQVAVTQQLEIAGQRRKRRERARIFREMVRIGLDAAAWSVHADVHWAFERALLANDRLKLAQKRVAIATDLLRVSERRVDVGEESPLAVEVARAELALAENASTAAAADALTSRILLASEIGWPAPRGLEAVGRLDAPSSPESGAELGRMAMKSNPTLRRTEAAKRAARSELATARREAWPSPTVGVNFAREGSTSTAENFSPPSTIWMGTIQIPIPTFARNQGPVARSRARVKVAEAKEHAMLVQFDAMVHATVARVDASARRSTAIETDVVPAFERSLAALRRSYDVGEMDYLEVAQALDRLWAMRQQALDARAAYYEAFADLERLVGPLDEAATSTSALADDGEKR